MHSLPVDLADLAEAFDLGNVEATFYIDKETGAVQPQPDRHVHLSSAGSGDVAQVDDVL